MNERERRNRARMVESFLAITLVSTSFVAFAAFLFNFSVFFCVRFFCNDLIRVWCVPEAYFTIYESLQNRSLLTKLEQRCTHFLDIHISRLTVRIRRQRKKRGAQPYCNSRCVYAHMIGLLRSDHGGVRPATLR